MKIADKKASNFAHCDSMLLTGESDYGTAISETEQFYQALKLRGIDTIMVRIPEASHHLTLHTTYYQAR